MEGQWDMKLGDEVGYIDADGVLHTETVESVAYTSPTAAIWPRLSWWQRLVRRFTPARWREPLQPSRPAEPAQFTINAAASAHPVGRTLQQLESMKRGIDRLLG